VDTRGGQRTREGDSEHARPARARHFLLTHRPARSPSYLSARSRHCLPTGLLARETADTRVRQARVTAYPPACSLGRQRTREGRRGLLTYPPACSLAVLPLCSLASLLTHRSARSGDSRHASETGTRHCLPTGLLARETADTRGRQTRVTAYPPACSLGRQARVTAYPPACSLGRQARVTAYPPACSLGRQTRVTACSLDCSRQVPALHPPACSLPVLPLCSLASLLTHRPARSFVKAGTSSTPTGLLAPRPTSLLARLTHPPANSARSRQASALAGGERLPARSLSHRPASSPSRLACLAATRLASLARQLARSRTLLPPRAPCCLLARSLDHRPVSASRLLAYQRAHRPVCASTDLLDW
jgi:hypothetical protein